MEPISIEGTPKTPSVKFDAATGNVEIKGRSIPENSIEFYDASDEGNLIKISAKENEKVPVPAGQWKLMEYKVDKTDYTKKKAGNVPFTYFKARSTKDYTPIVVKEGETADLPFGEPYKTSVQVRKYGNSQVSLQLLIQDCIGAICEDVLVDGSRPEEPSFAITTANGKIVERGKFSYG